MKKFLIALVWALLCLCCGSAANAATPTPVTSLPELSDAILVSGDSEIEIIGTIDFLVDSNDFTIDHPIAFTGSGTLRSNGFPLFNITGVGVSFTGVSFNVQGDTTAITISNGSVEFNGGNFNSVKTRLIESTGGNATFTNVSFANAGLTSTTATEFILISGGTATFGGGTTFSSFNTGSAATALIRATDGNVTFDGVKFNGVNGSALKSVVEASGIAEEVIINGGEFSGNGARAVSLDSVNGTIRADTQFMNNTGGAIQASGVSELTFEVSGDIEMTFNGNGALVPEVNGGALYIGEGVTVDFKAPKFTFTGNKATNGGAIWTDQVISAANFAKMTFTNNQAVENGGAVYSKKAIEIEGGTFGGSDTTKNIAGASGGAIFSEQRVNVSGGAVFSYNEANGGGGAIYSSSDVTITSVNFQSNKSKGIMDFHGGGAIYAEGKATVTNAEFEGNESEKNGGALYVGTANVTNSIFDNNIATANGGGLSARIAVEKVENCSFRLNRALNMGGAINLAGRSNIVNSLFLNNDATLGGGALFSSGTDQVINIGQSYFETNKVTGGSGGALLLTTTAELHLDRSTFSANTASLNGGAIACSAAYYGIANCTFVGNEASTGNGGGLYLGSHTSSDPDSAVFYCTFTANKSATGDGGGLYLDGGALMNLEANILVGNFATRGDDTFRNGASLTSGGYNVIREHGSTTGGDDYDWNADITGGRVRDDKWNRTYTPALLFATDPPTLASNEDLVNSLSTVFWAGAGLDLTNIPRHAVTTLALRPSTPESPNPAVRIFLDGSVARSHFDGYGLGFAHTDARGVNRWPNSSLPTGGSTCDAGAFQTINNSGGGGGAVVHVMITGLPNFTLYWGQTCTLRALVWVDGVLNNTPAVTWTSSNTNVATITQNGILTLVGFGDCIISATSGGVTHRVPVRVDRGGVAHNIAREIWDELADFNRLRVAKMELLAPESKDISVISKNSGRFEQIYGVAPRHVTALDKKGDLKPRPGGNYTGTLVSFKPASGVTVQTSGLEGGILPWQFTYDIYQSELEDVLPSAASRAVRSVTQSDIVALFNALSLRLTFIDENGSSVVVVDKDGSEGDSVASALRNGALTFNSTNDLTRIYFNVLLGDVKALEGKSAALIDDWFVVGDNNPNNGQIDGEMWLLQASDGGGGGNNGNNGGGDEGGGGGGCSAAGFAPVLLAIAALAVARRRKA